MKSVNNYNDYMIDLILEAAVNGEATLVFSPSFKSILNDIDHPISYKLLSENQEEGYKVTYIDLIDGGLDKVSFITAPKAAEVINKYKNRDKDYLISRDNYTRIFVDQELMNKVFTTNRSATTIGKLVSKLFPKAFPVGGKPGEDIQSFVDMFKSKRDIKNIRLVQGSDIVYWYNVDHYLKVNSGSLGNSCMKYEECQEFVQFYADNSKKVQLLIMTEEDENGEEKLRGRALVWNLSKPSGRIFMDRIYTNCVYDEMAFKAYAKKEGWLYKLNQNSGENDYIIDSKNDNKEYITFEVKDIHKSSTEYYPYMDTLKYFFPELNILTNNTDNMPGKYWELESTEGDYVQSGSIFIEGEWYDEDDLIYCILGEEYRLPEDAVFLSFYQQYATEEWAKIFTIEVDYYDNDTYFDENGNLRKTRDIVHFFDSKQTACKEYARRHLKYSNYYNMYIVLGREVFSKQYGTWLDKDFAVEVWTNKEKTEKDWREETDNTWWEDEGEKYDNGVSFDV